MNQVLIDANETRSTRASSTHVENERVLENRKRNSFKKTVLKILRDSFILGIAGALFGLSAPGFDQAYIAWIGLVPLLVATLCTPSGRQAFCRAFAFGACYILVYVHFILTLNSAWAFFNSAKYTLATSIFWMLLCASHQGIVFGVFGLLVNKLPLTSRLVPEWRFEKGASSRAGMRKLHLPIMWVVPSLWVALFNKLGNAPAVIGIPWTMIEYSQYRDTHLIQIASIIGGIGIGALIVLLNTYIFTVLTSFEKLFRPHSERLQFNTRVLPYATKDALIASSLFVTVLLAGVTAYGEYKLRTKQFPDRKIVASIVQGNLSTKATDATVVNVVGRYLTMTQKAPAGLCVWTEWVLPFKVREEATIVNGLLTLAKLQQQSWLIGSLEKGADNKTYNIVCAMDNGKLSEEFYRKRMLVPFMEQMPDWLAQTGVKKWLCTGAPYAIDLHPGNTPRILKLRQAAVGSLVCLEVVSPELVADSVRNGAEILADLSNTTWFHSPVVGKQLIAFSVFRAVETSRSLIFSTTTGPSAIIDPNGRIAGSTTAHKDELLVRYVELNNEITPFVRWFH